MILNLRYISNGSTEGLLPRYQLNFGTAQLFWWDYRSGFDVHKQDTELQPTPEAWGEVHEHTGGTFCLLAACEPPSEDSDLKHSNTIREALPRYTQSILMSSLGFPLPPKHLLLVVMLHYKFQLQ